MDEIDQITGWRHPWAEEAPTEKPTGEAQLATYIEQRFRNSESGQFLANHPELKATAGRLAQEGKLDLSKGEDGLQAFFREVVSELQKPEANGETGLVKEIRDWQRANGLTD